MSTTFGTQQSLAFPPAKLIPAAVGVQGPINIPPSASPIYLQAAEKNTEGAYAAFARHDIDNLMSYYSDDCTWLTNLPDDFSKNAPLWVPLKGNKEIRKFFDELLPKYINLEVFDIRGMTSGTCMNRAGIPCPRVVVTVNINATVLKTGKHYVETEYHYIDFDEKGNKMTNFQVIMNTLAALEAFSGAPEKERESEKVSLSQFQWVPQAVLERAKNNTLLAVTAWKNGDFEALNKFLANDVTLDYNSTWLSLLPADMRGVMLQSVRGADEVGRHFALARNAQKLLKYDCESLSAGAEWYTYNGHTKLLPTTHMLVNATKQIIADGKKIDVLQLCEFMWNEDGTKIVAMNRRMDNAQVKKTLLGK